MRCGLDEFPQFTALNISSSILRSNALDLTTSADNHPPKQDAALSAPYQFTPFFDHT
jgi:hypothetical protein